MHQKSECFDTKKAIEHLRHYLPGQAALKDFVHHNTLHAFQEYPFHDALWRASALFGYKTYLSLEEFRKLYNSGQIKPDALKQVIQHYDLEKLNGTSGSSDYVDFWMHNLLSKEYNVNISSRLFQLRKLWKKDYKINLSKIVHPLLFRILAAYLDQGIAQWKFPVVQNSFLVSLRSLEQNGYVSLFKTKRARKLLLDEKVSLKDLLRIIVGEESYYEQYLFDQQFAHPGWSGFVSVVENQPDTLLDTRNIRLEELIYFELLLEIDALDEKFGDIWKPLMIQSEDTTIQPLFDQVPVTELKTVLQLWQEAFEWSYFDSVLYGIQKSRIKKTPEKTPSFQGLFCIDDREYSLRRHLEDIESKAETFGTPGYFGVEFYFQPEHGKFFTKACPVSIDPKFLIKETHRKKKMRSEPHFQKGSHSLLWGGLFSGTLGFWSLIKLFLNLFNPSLGRLSVHSFEHSDKHADLQIEATGEVQSGLSIGFTVKEMAERVQDVLKSIGLTKNFAPIVYIVGHGGSSVNNPYYAGYDCGACCGRPGAVNARVFAYMANKKDVRVLLGKWGTIIPETTHFMGAMHDTTRDEIEFYDENALITKLKEQHEHNTHVFLKALELNAKERSYRFDKVNSDLPLKKLHQKVKDRSVSLFEPRPEWNHTDNALCIVGRKSLYENLYLDKRPFINSYDYSQDLDGSLLKPILGAAIAVCGGINLEYYFSRVDQQKLGAGTKLPHNVVGLFGLNTGVDGDLRTGLPSQMIEIHDPVRILFVVEHFPEVIDDLLKSNLNGSELVKNEWVLMVAIHPETGALFRFKNGVFKPYQPLYTKVKSTGSEDALLEVISKKEPILILK
ncbi:MAG: DUF2309 domain-containing protein [Gillisia sp.]